MGAFDQDSGLMITADQVAFCRVVFAVAVGADKYTTGSCIRDVNSGCASCAGRISERLRA